MTINKHNLVHVALQEIVDKIIEADIPNINCGGCGWFAHYILKEFERYNISNKEYKVIYIVDYGFEDSEEIEYNLQNQCGTRSCSHIMVKFQQMYVDAYNYEDDIYEYHEGYKRYKVNTTAKELRSACNYRPDWNNTYDYRAYNTELRKIIYNTFRKYLHGKS